MPQTSENNPGAAAGLAPNARAALTNALPIMV